LKLHGGSGLSNAQRGLADHVVHLLAPQNTLSRDQTCIARPLDPLTIGAQSDEFDGEGAVPYLRFAPDAQVVFSA
jgi:hypothetical protein